MNKKTLFLVLGFVLFIIGFLSLVLSLIGITFQFLPFDDQKHPLISFLTRIFMIVSGIVMAAWSTIDYEKEDGLY
jgi:uncharacterized membrane protein